LSELPIIHKYQNFFPIRKKTQIKFSNLESLIFHGGGGYFPGGILEIFCEEVEFSWGSFPQGYFPGGKGVSSREGIFRGRIFLGLNA
jgi:hypothetical protein